MMHTTTDREAEVRSLRKRLRCTALVADGVAKWVKVKPDELLVALGRESEDEIGKDTDDIQRVSEMLASDTGESVENVIRKGLALYAAGVDAERRDCTIAVVNAEDEIEREITGFGPSEEMP